MCQENGADGRGGRGCSYEWIFLVVCEYFCNGWKRVIIEYRPKVSRAVRARSIKIPPTLPGSSSIRSPSLALGHSRYRLNISGRNIIVYLVSNFSRGKPRNGGALRKFCSFGVTLATLRWISIKPTTLRTFPEIPASKCLNRYSEWAVNQIPNLI